MAVTVYKDAGHQGVFARLGPGFYSGRDLVGCPHQSTSCEDLDNAINSMRVDPNTIVAFADGHAISASGGGARVLIGPAEVPDLAALGMGNRISSVLVVPFRAYDSAVPAPEGVVVLCDGYAMTGRRSTLRRGDYPPARLIAEEVKMPGASVVSLAVEAHTVVVLYSGAAFEAAADAVMVVGPAVVDDLDRLGMAGRVASVRVLYSDPFDTPGRPALPVGAARAYTPGGGYGYWLGGPAAGARRRPGASDLILPGSPNPADPSNWAGAPLGPGDRPPAAAPAAAAPQVVYITPPAKTGPSWQVFALIILFIAIIAFAAFMSGRAAASPLERAAAEANLVAQAATPLALSAALF